MKKQKSLEGLKGNSNLFNSEKIFGGYLKPCNYSGTIYCWMDTGEKKSADWRADGMQLRARSI